jgi:hypothetical protein
MDTIYSDKNKGKKYSNKSTNEHKSDSEVNIYQTISDIINEETNTNIQINTIKTIAQIKEEFIKIVNEMTLEEVFININLISKIEPNYKLFINNKFINIDTSYVQSISRWFFGNDRKTTILFVNLVINKSFEYCDKLLNTKNIDTKLLFRITSDIKNSINGLLNLKHTYSSDKLVQAEIDVIIENIRNKIELNTTKLNNQ